MSLINSTSKKAAIVFSYLALFLNTVYAIFLTPILLRKLGVDEYGLYQMVYSVGHYILILDLGIGTVMVRYISEYRAKKDSRGESNFAAMIKRIVFCVMVAIVLVGIVVDYNIESIFRDLSALDYEKSHKMMGLMILQMAFVVWDHYYAGIISAYERFSFIKVLNIVQILLSFGLTVVFVCLGMGAVGVVLTAVVISFAKLVTYMAYVSKRLHFRSHYYGWDNSIVKPLLGLSFAIFLQSVIGNVNTSADKTILGIMCSKREVAMYSVGASIITMFNALPTVISGLFQPEVVRRIVHRESTSRLTDIVIRVGRWQLILCGAMLAGFFLFGSEFMRLWVGEEMKGALWVIFIIMPFNMIPLIQTACLSILNGLDKRLFRSLILVAMCIVKIGITIILIKHIGILGAPIGTAISYLLGHCITMNIYYAKCIHLEVRRMLKEIFSKIWLVVLFTSLLCLPLILWKEVSFFSFAVKVLTFLGIYAVLMYNHGFNTEEKGYANSLIRRFTKMVNR